MFRAKLLLMFLYLSFCYRFIHEHALNHYLETNHPLVIDVNELYVYCYECEEYVLNDNKSGDLKVLRETLQVNLAWYLSAAH